MSEDIKLSDIPEHEECPADKYEALPPEYEGKTRKEVIRDLLEKYSDDCVVACIEKWFPAIKDARAYLRAVKSQLRREKPPTISEDLAISEPEGTVAETEEQEEIRGLEVEGKTPIPATVIAKSYEALLKLIAVAKKKDVSDEAIKQYSEMLEQALSQTTIELSESATKKLGLLGIGIVVISGIVAVATAPKKNTIEEEEITLDKHSKHSQGKEQDINALLRKAWRK